MYHSDKSQDICTFTVNKSFGDDESFFRLQTGKGEIFLNKLPFQIGQPLPDTLSCRIKGYNGDIPVVAHNMPIYVSEFYADGASRGEEFEFKVTSVPDDGTPYYRLIDDHGLIFKLNEQKSVLSKGQSVKCRFSVLDHKMFKLQRSDSETMFSMVSLGDCARVAGVHNVSAKTIETFLASVPELEASLDEYKHGRAHWIISAMRALKIAFPRLFRNAVAQHPLQHVSDAINGYGNVLLYLLQGSGFLRNVKGSLRNEIQAELTQQIEQLEIYKRTIEITGSRTQTKFIDNLLNNLKESGYLYHPITQFSILMILFRMQPQLINYSLGSIFDTLMGWDPDTWKAEPFRQAFVEQLEIYIAETREEIDRFLVPETAEDNKMIERMIIAIAIQHSLALDTDAVDMRLNRSLFYRYLSLLRSAKADVLLNKSYLTLLDVKLPTDFTWADIKESTMLMTRAAVDPPKTALLPENPRYFISGDIEVEVGRDGINIAKYDDDGSIPAERHTFPEWPGLSLNVNIKKNFTRARLKSLDGYAEFWNAAENALFLKDATPVEQVTRRAPDIGDTVKIIIEDVRHSDDDYNRVTALVCRVADDHFTEAEGIMNTGDLVTYKLYGVTAGTFRYPNGEHMVFEAKVTDIDDEDRYSFSMIETTKAVTRDLVDVGDECLCVITRENANSYSAISEKGCGLFVSKLGGNVPPFRAGNVIRVEITGFDNDAVQGEYIEGPIDNYTFSNSQALRSMLLAIAVRDVEEENGDLDDADFISRQDIREISQILRYAAVAQQDYIIRSFNYLSFARMLALIINDNELANEIKAHKEILLLHQHYAKNKSLYIEDITAAENIAPDSMLARRMASRLKIVAALGHPEEDEHLWQLISASENEGEKELAHTVLSYNLLYEVNRDESTGSKLKDIIASKLNVSDEQRRLKYYGTESQYVEFKSSLVYPARKGRSGISLADPDAQEFEILHIIAGFLNSTGGNLYIGVSDDHYECGLDDDFNFYKLDTSARNTPHRRNIKSLDNMANHLQQLIDKSFNLGGNIGNYAYTYVDNESKKGVIGVKINPCPHLVTLDGKIYVRHGSKTEPLLKEDEIALFKADREQLYKQVMAASAHEPAENSPAPEDPSYQAEPAAAENEPETATTPQVSGTFSLATSATRRNVLHDWEDPENFVDPVCYILFNNNNTFSITEKVWGGEEEDCRLILAVTADEAHESLLLVYEGELAIKIRMKDLLDKPRNVEMPLLADHKLIFASPVKSSEGLYSLHINSRGAIYERVTPADRIASGFKPLSPERLIEAECESSPFYEIIPAEMMPSFSALTPANFKRTQIGSLAKGSNPGRISVEEIKTSLINRIARS